MQHDATSSVSRSLAGSELPKLADETKEVGWMQKQAGKYPFEIFGSLLVDGPFGFGLETQTLPTYGRPFMDRPVNVLNPMLTHELAHQWYGDSVSPYTWSDVWRNEGQAAFCELKYADETGGGPDYYGQRTLEDIYQHSDELRAANRPVAMPRSSVTVLDVFNENVYDGGALAFEALRLKVDDTELAEIEKKWPAVYRGRSASTDDFIHLASKISGQNLASFLTGWLYSTATPPMPGHPDRTTNRVTAARRSSIRRHVDRRQCPCNTRPHPHAT
ncbi:M1 family aminopeptidase [Actinoplanes sp. NPDC051343]|uniref:M1 family aminopeptidase n=1 Tax=Actinoplanes sp. NPDC051343 TaxID=3363906 RepID=UPI00378E7574